MAVAAALIAAPASAQRPVVPDPWQYGKRQDPAALRFCVDTRDPDWKIAQEIGEAVAGALLLQPKPHVVESALVIQELEDLYIFFLRNCDIYMGFKLLPGVYPDWLVVSRAYYQTSYIVAAIEPGWSALADMPVDRPIGSAIATASDFRLLSYLQAIDASKRWPRYPMANNEAAFKAVLDGTVGAALAWAPSLWALQLADPAYARVRAISPRPLPASSIGVGAAMLAEETFVRSNVDRAIASLLRDKTIQRILDRHKFPATAAE